MLIRHIIVATDESEAGRSAVRAGLDLAERAFRRVTVTRVVPLEALPLLGSAVGSVGPDGAVTALERLQRWLHAELRPGCPVPVEPGIAFGLPGIEIRRFAEQRQADLLVPAGNIAVLLSLASWWATPRTRWSGEAACPACSSARGPAAEPAAVALDGSDRGTRAHAAARDFAQSVGLGRRWSRSRLAIGRWPWTRSHRCR